MSNDLSAEAIRSARLAAGMSQVELARRLGVVPVTVRYWEWGKRTPAVGLRPALAAILYGPNDRTMAAIMEEIRELAPVLRARDDVLEAAIARGMTRAAIAGAADAIGDDR